VNPALQVGYEGVAQLARALTAVAPTSRHKLLATFAERRGAIARYHAFRRDTARPLLWMHAPSVGEGLQARPVLESTRRLRPDAQLAYTYFSPSARAFARSLDVDFQDVLPFDTTGDMRAALGALTPAALVFSKLDLWPTLAREASRRGTRLGMISATLAERSSRRSRLASSILRDAYGRLDRVGAVSTDDADRLVALGVPARRITVTGDTRYDQVWSRTRDIGRAAATIDPLRAPRPTLVAGSTWPADEAMLLPAWSTVASQHPDVRLIIAPHEPSVAHLASIEAWAHAAGLRLSRLGADDVARADVVLVDRLGVLGDLYDLANLAFVGGGFHAAGLHSVLEPAAFGAAVLFGPRHESSRDARLLLDADGALEMPDRAALESTLESWARGDAQWFTAGTNARRVVHSGLGAADRSYALVSELLG
jgi:3-deoxy-D-manno-octulosonic-acid transferase